MVDNSSDISTAINESKLRPIHESTGHEHRANVMAKEICCNNWNLLFDYLENAPNLATGLKGRDAADKFLEGLIDNPLFLIRDPYNENSFIPSKKSTSERARTGIVMNSP